MVLLILGLGRGGLMDEIMGWLEGVVGGGGRRGGGWWI